VRYRILNIIKNKFFKLPNFIIKTIFIFALIYSACLAEIVDSKGHVLKEVIEIFHIFEPLIEQCSKEIFKKTGLSKVKIDEILKNQNHTKNISLNDLNDIAQVVFLRPNTIERKDSKPLNKNFLPYTNERLLNLFRTIGDIDTKYPKRQTYRYVLLNGSTVKNMRFRLKTLVTLVKAGRLIIDKNTEIVFLTGARDLFPEENEQQFVDPSPLKQDPKWQRPDKLPTTEDQAAEWIWNQSNLPPSLRHAQIIFIKAKKIPEFDPVTRTTSFKRPTTLSTFQAWIEEYKPHPGKCVSISNQPYVHYQAASFNGVLKKEGLLEKGFTVEGVGFSSKPKTLESFKDDIAIYMDNLARSIYVEAH